MKKIILIFSIIGIVGCSDGYHERNFPVRPDELKDCKIYQLESSGGGSITVVRCPQSATSTTYKSGKTTVNTVVIDGVEYEKAKK